MQLQTTVPESKLPDEYSGVIFIQIDQHLKKLLQKYKGPDIMNHGVVYIPIVITNATAQQESMPGHLHEYTAEDAASAATNNAIYE